MCKEINKLIKIIFVCTVHPRQRFPSQGKKKGQGVVRALGSPSDALRYAQAVRPAVGWRRSADAAPIPNTASFLSSLPRPVAFGGIGIPAMPTPRPCSRLRWGAPWGGRGGSSRLLCFSLILDLRNQLRGSRLPRCLDSFLLPGPRCTRPLRTAPHGPRRSRPCARLGAPRSLPARCLCVASPSLAEGWVCPPNLCPGLPGQGGQPVQAPGPVRGRCFRSGGFFGQNPGKRPQVTLIFLTHFQPCSFFY